MKRFLSVVLLSIAAGCSSSEPMPDPKPAAAPVQEQPVGEQSVEDASYIEYNYKDGRTRAYLAFTSPICQQDETAEPVYEIQALWKYDSSANTWESLDVAPDVPYRLACNAMLDLVNVLGYDLEPATYAIEAEIGGTTERDVFYVGDAMCNDVELGAAPDGQVALCVVGPDSAKAKFVPDPAILSE